MGEQASVDVEPPSQTALIDKSMETTGVLISGVPGGSLHLIYDL
jgi:phosphomevalonate kinase